MSFQWNMCYSVPKLYLGSQGRAKKMKKLHVLFANWHIPKAITFNNILTNSHSISGLLINGIFHILIHWVKDTDFQKLNMCLRCLWILLPLLLTPAAGAQRVGCAADLSTAHRTTYCEHQKQVLQICLRMKIYCGICVLFLLWICSFNSCKIIIHKFLFW